MGQIRWLAILAGFLAFIIATLSLGPMIQAIPLVVGAIVQPRAKTTGRWLMWVGALLSSEFMIPFAVRVAVDLPKTPPDFNAIAISSLFLLSAALLLSCDLALVLNAAKEKTPEWAHGTLDWIVWIVAFALTVWGIWLTHSVGNLYRNAQWEQLFTMLWLIGPILLLDAALIIRAFKSPRLGPR